MKNVSKLGWVSLALSIVGALNWGFIGFFDIDLVAHLFNGHAHLVKGTYMLVGVAGLYGAYSLFLGCSTCKKSG